LELYEKLKANTKKFAAAPNIKTMDKAHDWIKASMATIMAHYISPCTFKFMPIFPVVQSITAIGALITSTLYYNTITSYSQHLQNDWSDIPKCLDDSFKVDFSERIPIVIESEDSVRTAFYLQIAGQAIYFGIPLLVFVYTFVDDKICRKLRTSGGFIKTVSKNFNDHIKLYEHLN